MKNRIILLIFLLMSISFINAQNEESSGLDVGFQLNETASNFGIGINVSSPRLLKNSMQVRLRANAMFLDYTTLDQTLTEPYFNLLLGASSATAKISEAIGLYGEGGVALILPSNKFSNNKYEVGGYGLFGFEFYFNQQFTYFLEAGAVGIDASAEKVPQKPNYSNGFSLSVGFKLKL